VAPRKAARESAQKKEAEEAETAEAVMEEAHDDEAAAPAEAEAEAEAVVVEEEEEEEEVEPAPPPGVPERLIRKDYVPQIGAKGASVAYAIDPITKQQVPSKICIAISIYLSISVSIITIRRQGDLGRLRDRPNHQAAGAIEDMHRYIYLHLYIQIYIGAKGASVAYAIDPITKQQVPSNICIAISIYLSISVSMHTNLHRVEGEPQTPTHEL